MVRIEECVEEYCASCARVCAFERPPCLDGHGDECAEWCCTGCGAAILIDPPLLRFELDGPVPVRSGRESRAA